MKQEMIPAEVIPNFSAELVNQLQAALADPYSMKSYGDAYSPFGVQVYSGEPFYYGIDDLIRAITLSPKFLLPDEGFVIRDFDMCLNNVPEKLCLPYPSVCLEFFATASEMRLVLLCENFEFEGNECIVIHASGQSAVSTNEEPTWISYPMLVILEREKGKTDVGTDSYYMDRKYENEMSEKEVGEYDSFIDALSYLLLDFLVCVNLQGFSCEKFVPTKSCKKRRIRQRKLPFFEYHVLGIGLNNLQYKKYGSVQNPGTGGKHRFHSVRGHVRHYDNYDSGKIAWVRPHFAGNPALGIIKKDYSLK